MAERKPTNDATDQTTREDTEMTTQDDPLLRERKRMYGGFIKLLAYSTAATAIILILLAIFLL